METFIVIVTKKGLILKYHPKQLRDMSRGCKGVRGIVLEDGDEVAAAFSITQNVNQPGG